MTLYNDSPNVKVRTIYKSEFPKGTVGKVITCRLIGGTSTRVYLFVTEEPIDGFVDGSKSSWYLDRDLENVTGS
jgi:ribosomal protein S1